MSSGICAAPSPFLSSCPPIHKNALPSPSVVATSYPQLRVLNRSRLYAPARGRGGREEECRRSNSALSCSLKIRKSNKNNNVYFFYLDFDLFAFGASHSFPTGILYYVRAPGGDEHCILKSTVSHLCTSFLLL